MINTKIATKKSVDLFDEGKGDYIFDNNYRQTMIYIFDDLVTIAEERIQKMNMCKGDTLIVLNHNNLILETACRVACVHLGILFNRTI